MILNKNNIRIIIFKLKKSQNLVKLYHKNKKMKNKSNNLINKIIKKIKTKIHKYLK